MRFFNFWNVQTYHAFQWVTANKGLAGLDAMITAAADAIEPVELTINDVCEATRDRLARELEELIEEQFAEFADRAGAIYSASEMSGFAEDAEGNTNSLLLPLSADAMRKIDCRVVAEAILIRAGKWNRDMTIPEIHS